MSGIIAPDRLRLVLSSEELGNLDPFDVLRSIAALGANPDNSDLYQEMLLRALDRQDSFTEHRHILDTMLRSRGLFPYIEQENLGQLSIGDIIAYEFHKPSPESNDFVFHREQAIVFRRLLAGENVVLSAPTSFGKSRIVDAIIETG